MPIAKSSGTAIHYEVVGEGRPLVLYHAFCGTHLDWHEFGYVDHLSSRYRLYMLDARGHGASGKPSSPAEYTPERQVSDVLAVVDAEGLNEPIYWGYSMGGRVGFALARHAPTRFSKLIIGGIHPYPQNPSGIQKRIDTWRGGLRVIEPFMAEGFGRAWSERQRRQFLANDLDAMLAYLGALPDFDYADALDAKGAPPSLYYVGEADRVFFGRAREYAEAHSRVIWRPLPGLDHYAAYYRSDIVAPMAIEFLEGGDE